MIYKMTLIMMIARNNIFFVLGHILSALCLTTPYHHDTLYIEVGNGSLLSFALEAF